MKFSKILGLVTVLFISLNSKNSEASSLQNLEAINSGKVEIKQTAILFKNNIKNAELVEKTMQAILKVATHKMKKLGFNKEAEQIDLEWQEMSSLYLNSSTGFLDLGDHRPLSQWMAKTYDKIEKIIGKRYCEWAHLDDIKSINYGFFVAIHPEGDPETQTPWGSVEYLKHFVPFTTAITYWPGNIACSVALNIVGSLVCSLALELPRYEVKHYLAPHMGKDIYNHYNKKIN